MVQHSSMNSLCTFGIESSSINHKNAPSIYPRGDMVNRILLVIAFMILFASNFCYHHVYGIVTENGTCTNGVVFVGNKTYILNQSYADFIKNLTYDNRILAEILCEQILNQSVAR